MGLWPKSTNKLFCISVFPSTIYLISLGRKEHLSIKNVQFGAFLIARFCSMLLQMTTPFRNIGYIIFQIKQLFLHTGHHLSQLSHGYFEINLLKFNPSHNLLKFKGYISDLHAQHTNQEVYNVNVVTYTICIYGYNLINIALHQFGQDSNRLKSIS